MRRHYLLLVCLLSLCAFVSPGVVLAHPEIIRTAPPADAQLTQSPPQVRVEFNEALEEAFSSVAVYNPQGQQMDAGDGRRSTSNPAVLEVPLPALEPGIYTVVWQTTGSDGHTIKGNFSFTVLGSDASTVSTAVAAETSAPLAPPTPTPPAAVPAASQDPPSFVVALLRALMLLGALGAVGGWALSAAVLHPSLGGTNVRAARDNAFGRWRRGVWVSLAVLLFATGAFAVMQTLSVTGELTLANLWTYLRSTRLGQALLQRIALALILALILAATKKLPVRYGVVTLLLSAMLLFSFSFSGHAAAQQAAVLPILADWTHLVATSVWVGGLFLLVFVLPALLRVLPQKDSVSVLARLIDRFSTLALISVLTLTITGTYTALLHIRALSDLWTSDYGRSLLIKICLFGGLLLLGVYQMFLVRPRFLRWTQQAAETITITRWQQYFQRGLRAEVVLAVLTIGVVGFLTNTAPPSTLARQPSFPATTQTAINAPVSSATSVPRPTRTPVPSEPFSQTQTVADMQVGLDVTPAILGENTIQVTVRDTGGAPLDVQKVLLTFEMLDMDMGVTSEETVPEGQGRYVAAKSWLSMVGSWQVTVTVRRADVDDAEVTFMVPVGG